MNSNNDTKNLKKSCLKHSRGFTLVELLVTLSLFVVLTTVVLFSNSQFNGSILLTNLAYDVALTVRQAQTYGVNVREDTVENVGDKKFQHAYGVHFEIAENKKFFIFSDNDGDGIYDSGESKINSYNIKRGNYIKAISCVGDTLCGSILDITFLRPNPDAKINNNDNITQATITVTSADDGSERRIVVNSTGQISVTR